MLRNIKLKEREETNGILVVPMDIEFINMQRLRKSLMTEGKITLGFHYLVDFEGNIHAGQLIDTIASPLHDETETKVVVLIDTKDVPNSCQNKALSLIKEQIKKKYKIKEGD